MGSLQVPGARLVRALSPRAARVPPTIIAATGFVVMAVRLACRTLRPCAGRNSIQHPRGPLLIVKAYAPAARGTLATYPFAGDRGKATPPGSAALLLPTLAWRLVIASWRCLARPPRCSCCS